jgi:hypothetical protein
MPFLHTCEERTKNRNKFFNILHLILNFEQLLWFILREETSFMHEDEFETVSFLRGRRNIILIFSL